MSTTEHTVEAGLLTAAGGREPAEMRRFLVVYPGAGDDHSRVVDLADGTEVTFGRSRASTIAIDHEKVSRSHARLVRRGETITIEDLGSRNGTFVNGVKIEKATEVGAGDEIGIGPATAMVGASSRPRREDAVELADPDLFEQRLGAECDRAVRFHRPVAVVMLRLGGGPAEVDAAIDRLARAARRMDLIAEWSEDEIAVMLPEADRAAGLEQARRMAAEARAAGAAVHLGVAAFPEDGAAPDELIAQARAALRSARSSNAEVAAPPNPVTPPNVVVVDPAMRRVYELVARIADTPMTVLILGETGVGKELVAEALHRGSSRRDKVMLKLNCASLPETLLESELFGYERGAFTGADRRKQGYFEAATGGTLFLDEIGEMPLGLQAKLLHVLERRTITRVGSTQEVPVDVRLVAATHRDLEGDCRVGRFREDLFFRVSGFTLIVPPLRDRRSEVVPLALHFAAAFASELGQSAPRFTEHAEKALGAWDWPGNVRELKNAIERAVVLSGGQRVDVDHLPDKIRDAARRAAPRPATAPGDMKEHLAEVERAAIEAALAEHNGNQTRAAARLGISRRALIYKMEKHGLKPPPGAR
ncbi:MAG TPA: sigma 54-interacting transcriptional regulator [Kofleriaceae bacterium]|nr:sigma 54-interacting transcriptional regulator [Kofleriaceae bacterium]